MTDEMMTLRTLLEKSSDTDLLRGQPKDRFDDSDRSRRRREVLTKIGSGGLAGATFKCA